MGTTTLILPLVSAVQNMDNPTGFMFSGIMDFSNYEEAEDPEPNLITIKYNGDGAIGYLVNIGTAN